MFGNMDMGNLGEMLSEVQKKAQEMQEESAAKVYEAKSGGGMVHVKAKDRKSVV